MLSIVGEWIIITIGRVEVWSIWPQQQRAGRITAGPFDEDLNILRNEFGPHGYIVGRT